MCERRIDSGFLRRKADIGPRCSNIVSRLASKLFEDSNPSHQNVVGFGQSHEAFKFRSGQLPKVPLQLYIGSSNGGLNRLGKKKKAREAIQRFVSDKQF
jgi:hypothetical protein